MKLYEKIPKGITANGRFFRCNWDFRNVLKMLEIMQREDIQLDARDYLCAKCLVSHKIPSKFVSAVYNELCDVLFPKTPETPENSEKLMSFEQDAALIRAAFLQEYRINLYHDKLSWFEFTELLQCLPDGNRFENAVSIRARPLPKPTKYNTSEREWLIKAKRSVALHLTESEQRKKYDKQVGNVFAALMSMIPQKEVKSE